MYPNRHPPIIIFGTKKKFWFSEMLKFFECFNFATALGLKDQLIQANFDVSVLILGTSILGTHTKKEVSTYKESLLLGLNAIILSQSYHRKPPQSDDFWGSHPGPSFQGFTTLLKPPDTKEKEIFVAMTPPNYFSRLVPECLTQKNLVPYLFQMCVIC